MTRTSPGELKFAPMNVAPLYALPLPNQRAQRHREGTFTLKAALSIWHLTYTVKKGPVPSSSPLPPAAGILQPPHIGIDNHVALGLTQLTD